MVTWLLSSPMAGMVDASLLLLEVPGRRSGAIHRFPVQYAVGEDGLWVWPADAGHKTWWRNLRAPTPVTVRLLGHDVAGTGHALDGTQDPEQVRRGMAAYAARFPRTGRRLPAVGDGAGPGVGTDPTVMVRIEVDADELAAARRVTRPGAHGVVGSVRRHPLATYYLLAFLCSWSWWLPVALTGADLGHVPGLLGPAIAGVVTSAVVGGRPALADLWSRAIRWRVPARWFAVSLAPMAVAALTLAVLAATGRGLPGWDALASFPGLPTTSWPMTFALVLLLGGFGEEVGWRGVAWPRLRRRHSLAGAAAMLALPWALWHVPLFWLPTGLGDLDALVVPGWLVGLAAGTVVLGWLHDRAAGSLLVVALFHASLNMASATVGTAGVPATVTSAAVIAGAVVILRHAGSE